MNTQKRKFKYANIFICQYGYPSFQVWKKSRTLHENMIWTIWYGRCIYDFWLRLNIIQKIFSWSLPQFESMIDPNEVMNEDAYIVKHNIIQVFYCS